MKGLDRDARSLVEMEIDGALKDSVNYEKNIRTVLRVQGIEPNLETVLSFITGLIWGRLIGFYSSKYHRHLNRGEMREVSQLLKRRAFELRQVFISTRIEE